MRSEQGSLDLVSEGALRILKKNFPRGFWGRGVRGVELLRLRFQRIHWEVLLILFLSMPGIEHPQNQ